MNSNRRCIHSGTLSAYMDGELSDAEGRRLALHIENCGLCRETLDDMRRLSRHLQTLPAATLGFDLTPILEQRLAIGKENTSAPRRWGALPLSFAASLTAAFGILLGSVLADAPARAGDPPPAMALFDAIPPGGLCIGLDTCYRKEKI